LKRESGSKPELSPQLYALHRGGHPHATASGSYQLDSQSQREGRPPGSASQETCQGTHRFSARGGRAENENGCFSYLLSEKKKAFFGLSPSASFGTSQKSTQGFGLNFRLKI
jgi:hypothetical protein